MKFASVGDILAQRRLSLTYEGFDEIVNWMSASYGVAMQITGNTASVVLD